MFNDKCDIFSEGEATLTEKDSFLYVTERKFRYSSSAVYLDTDKDYTAEYSIKSKNEKIHLSAYFKVIYDFKGKENTSYISGEKTEITPEEYKEVKCSLRLWNKIQIKTIIAYIVQGNNEPLDDYEISSFEITAHEHKPMEKENNIFDEKCPVGSIRWDAFFETDSTKSNVSQQVAKALSPKEFNWHAPFFSSLDADGNITFPGYSMEIINKEIDYAKEAGLDYFAYLWYETSDPMSDPRKIHLQSEKKNDVLMCGILETIRSSATMNELYEAMKDECYVRIDNRPVVFLYQYDSKWTQEMIDQLRKAAAKAGVTEALYLVGMVGNDTKVIFQNSKIKDGAEAFSWYAQNPNKRGGMEYSEFIGKVKERIDNLGSVSGACSYSLIPCVVTGYDVRPRIKNPVSWVGGDPTSPDQNKWPYGNSFTLDASPEEIGDLLNYSLNYVKQNPNNTKANMVLTYAWNEHDEGGWICPTIKCDENGNLLYNDDGSVQIDTQRIDAYKKVIDEYRKTEHEVIEATPDATEEPINNDETPTNGNNTVLYIIISAVAIVVIGAVVIIVIKKKKK